MGSSWAYDNRSRTLGVISSLDLRDHTTWLASFAHEIGIGSDSYKHVQIWESGIENPTLTYLIADVRSMLASGHTLSHVWRLVILNRPSGDHDTRWYQVAWFGVHHTYPCALRQYDAWKILSPMDHSCEKFLCSCHQYEASLPLFIFSIRHQFVLWKLGGISYVWAGDDVQVMSIQVTMSIDF